MTDVRVGFDANGRRRWLILAERLTAATAQERDRLILWTPVLFGVGVSFYFLLPREPDAAIGTAATLIAVLAVALLRRGGQTFLCAIAVFLVAAGFALAQRQALDRAAPVIQREAALSVTGRLLDPRAGGRANRWLIAPSGISGIDDNELPARVRITMRDGGGFNAGEGVQVRAVLSPPPAPAAPGAFDFARMAWFDRLGGIGFAVGPPQRVTDAGPLDVYDRVAAALTRLRHRIADRIYSHRPDASGAIAAALMTGDRSRIPGEVTETLRDSGLAHLLAISGLHMGLVAGTIFFALRFLFVSSGHAALHHPVKKWSAAGAVLGAAVYMALAGASVPTERAFVMTAVVLGAIIVDRAAVSMRLVALAAGVVLVIAPDSLLHVGFQMSFAAVIALVAVYERLGHFLAGGGRSASVAARVVRYAAGLAVTSVVAGGATAFFAAYHFNRIAEYGLAANLVAMPITAFWIMPWGLIAILFMPLGLEALPVIAMAAGIDIVLAVGEIVSTWPGAVAYVTSPDGWVLPLFTIGALWVALWRTWFRLLGILPVAIALTGFWAATPPDILVTAEGGLVALKTTGPDDEGAYLMTPTTRDRFAAETWLRRAGLNPNSPSPAPGTAGAGHVACDTLGCVLRAWDRAGAFVVLAHAHDGRALVDDCRRADVVIATVVVRRCAGPRLVIDRFDLARDGAHAVWFDGPAPAAPGRAEIRVRTVRGQRGERPWTEMARPAWEKTKGEKTKGKKAQAGP